MFFMLVVTKHKPRTYRIIGPQRQIDERETPRPRAERGELGERIRLLQKIRAISDTDVSMYVVLLRHFRYSQRFRLFI